MDRKFEMIGSTKYREHDYTIEDCKGMVTADSMGLFNFYGGRVKKLGKTSEAGLYLCLEGNEVINLIFFYADPKPIEEKHIEIGKDPDEKVFGGSDEIPEEGYDVPTQGTPEPPTEEKPKEPTKDTKAKTLPRKKK